MWKWSKSSTMSGSTRFSSSSARLTAATMRRASAESSGKPRGPLPTTAPRPAAAEPVAAGSAMLPAMPPMLALPFIMAAKANIGLMANIGFPPNIAVPPTAPAFIIPAPTIWLNGPCTPCAPPPCTPTPNSAPICAPSCARAVRLAKACFRKAAGTLPRSIFQSLGRLKRSIAAGCISGGNAMATISGIMPAPPMPWPIKPHIPAPMQPPCIAPAMQPPGISVGSTGKQPPLRRSISPRTRSGINSPMLAEDPPLQQQPPAPQPPQPP
mmetsp:Transcript_118217/g.376845  ORF Transcript_118217/g.376845 Transcript_118217/m.376845 type:complete len:268 (+) Transcript_118217:698-1501(+)